MGLSFAHITVYNHHNIFIYILFEGDDTVLPVQIFLCGGFVVDMRLLCFPSGLLSSCAAWKIGNVNTDHFTPASSHS